MTEIPVPLSDQQITVLEKRATEQHISVPELLRTLVEKELHTTRPRLDREQRLRALEIVGRFNSGLGDLSVRHDDYLAEVYDE